MKVILKPEKEDRRQPLLLPPGTVFHLGCTEGETWLVADTGPTAAAMAVCLETGKIRYLVDMPHNVSRVYERMELS